MWDSKNGTIVRKGKKLTDIVVDEIISWWGR